MERRIGTVSRGLRGPIIKGAMTEKDRRRHSDGLYR